MHQPITNNNHVPTSVPNKQLVINLYHKQVHQPCTNLYHQRVHQPCTKYVPIMHQLHINYDSSRCTNIINYTPHVCVNSSTTCLNHVPNMYLNQNPSSISSSKSDLITYTSNTIPQVCTSNHVLEPHCYTTSICTNNFNNIPQPKSLKHEPELDFNRSTSDQLYNKP
jgi:hypothetical protein